MSDHFLHNDGFEHPSQDWVGGPERNQPTHDCSVPKGNEKPPLDWSIHPVREVQRRIDKALQDIAHSGASKDRQRAFEIIRDTLEESGIPFTRANTLAEKCYRALAEVL